MYCQYIVVRFVTTNKLFETTVLFDRWYILKMGECDCPAHSKGHPTHSWQHTSTCASQQSTGPSGILRVAFCYRAAAVAKAHLSMPATSAGLQSTDSLGFSCCAIDWIVHNMGAVQLQKRTNARGPGTTHITRNAQCWTQRSIDVAALDWRQSINGLHSRECHLPLICSKADLLQ